MCRTYAPCFLARGARAGRRHRQRMKGRCPWRKGWCVPQSSCRVVECSISLARVCHDDVSVRGRLQQPTWLRWEKMGPDTAHTLRERERERERVETVGCHPSNNITRERDHSKEFAKDAESAFDTDFANHRPLVYTPSVVCGAPDTQKTPAPCDSGSHKVHILCETQGKCATSWVSHCTGKPRGSGWDSGRTKLPSPRAPPMPSDAN